MVEQFPLKEEVEGSNPSRLTRRLVSQSGSIVLIKVNIMHGESFQAHHCFVHFMKIIKKVSSKEVKRAFVISDSLRFHKGNTQHMALVTSVEFNNLLQKHKKQILTLGVNELNSHMTKGRKQGKKYMLFRQSRLNAYSNYSWFLARFSTHELGVWKNAGGLPYSWTKDSLFDTAKYINKYLFTSKIIKWPRIKYALKGITSMLGTIKEEKYLYPIVFMAGSGTKGRRWCNKMKGDIDDGNMRAISLAASGEKFITVYFGKPN